MVSPSITEGSERGFSLRGGSIYAKGVCCCALSSRHLATMSWLESDKSWALGSGRMRRFGAEHAMKPVRWPHQWVSMVVCQVATTGVRVGGASRSDNTESAKTERPISDRALGLVTTALTSSRIHETATKAGGQQGAQNLQPAPSRLPLAFALPAGRRHPPLHLDLLSPHTLCTSHIPISSRPCRKRAALRQASGANMALDNDTRGWIMTAMSGIGRCLLSVPASEKTH